MKIANSSLIIFVLAGGLTVETMFEERIVETLAQPVSPHIETAIITDSPTPNVAMVFASGGMVERTHYRLFLETRYNRDAQTGIKTPAFRLRGIPMNSHPVIYQQFMYGEYATLDELSTVLGRFLPHAQLRAVRRALLAGKFTEIGGHISGSLRLFDEAKLRALGMNFRPFDT